jgi:Mg2+/Co2+ transporter CorB
MDLVITTLIIVALLGCSAFFSMSETALTSVSRPKMIGLSQEGHKRAASVLRLLDQQDRLIGTVLLGNNLINILASAITTEFMLHTFGDVGIAIATGMMTILILIFAEVLPKSYALNQADKVSLAIAPVMQVICWVLFPPTWAVSWIVRRIGALLGANMDKINYAISAEELRGAIEMHMGDDESDGDAIRHERVMLRSILDLADVTVEKIMTHRKNIEMLDAAMPIEELINQSLSSPYTRLPMYQDKPENVIGILHTKLLAKQLRAAEGDKNSLDIVASLSEPWYIPETMTLFDQLQEFRSRKEHMAMVVDEYGSMLGLVTREDILEEIVGRMEETHDEEKVDVTSDTPDSYVVDGATTIRDLNRQFDWNLPDEEYATIAGLILYESQTLPQVGQSFTFYDFRFDVLERHRHQIMSVRVTPLKKLTAEKRS